MKKFIPALGLVALIAAPALAQMGLTKDAAKIDAGTYMVEPNHTRVVFAVDHFGFTTYNGDFTKTSGTLTIDPKRPDASALDVTIATDSVLVPNEKLLGELKGDQWLDAAKFPTITFKSTKVVKTTGDNAKVTGDFTMHGVTKPLTLDVKFNAAGTNPANKNYTIGFDAVGKIKRTDFGVKTYAPYIGDDVDIKISAAFEKQK